MNPKFASHIDPLFEYVLNLLERAESGRNPDPEVEKARIRNQLEQIDASLGHIGAWCEDWKLARYAMVAWIDECLVYGCTWDGASVWQRNLLEVDLYKEESEPDDAAEEFFKEAEKASQLKRKDALEVFYLAVILGYRGVYRSDSGDTSSTDSTLRRWLKVTSAAISAGRPEIYIPTTVAPHVEDGGQPLNGKFEFLGSFVLLIVLLSILGIILAAKQFL